MPWYNELDDQLDIEDPEFPNQYREQIQKFGPYTIITINQKVTHLEKKEEN
jgi:hypothetical protein